LNFQGNLQDSDINDLENGVLEETMQHSSNLHHKEPTSAELDIFDEPGKELTSVELDIFDEPGRKSTKEATSAELDIFDDVPGTKWI
jgi:hypothetical protein